MGAGRRTHIALARVSISVVRTDGGLTWIYSRVRKEHGQIADTR